MPRLHLKIGQRLALGYGFVIVLLITMTLVGIVKLGTLADTTDDTLRDKYPKTVMVNDVVGALGTIARAMRNTLIMTEPEQLKEQMEDISRAKRKMADTLDQLNRRVTESKGKELLQQIDIIRSAYIVNQEEFIELLNQRRMGEAKNLLLVDLNPYQSDFFSLLDQLNAHQGELMDQASRDVAQGYRTARRVLLIMTALAALLSIAITVLITRQLLGQLGGEPDYAATIARQIAAGDLSSGIELGPKDQASLLFAMKGMRDKLIERSDALQGANAELAHSIETLNRTQDDLVRSEKLAALGALVAGIAHELNTPIGNSLLAASALVDHTRSFTLDCANGLRRSALEEHIEDVNKAGDILLRNLFRAADLVASFKQVAVDRESSQGRTFALNDMVTEVMLTLWPTIKKSPVNVQQEIPKDIVMNSYPGPLGQVITNLVNNALIHAFEGRDSGTVLLSARATVVGWIELCVQDDGIGIAPEFVKRIYDPFFTTKLGKGGSGLGLNIAYNIVHGILGGKIDVATELGVGTTFTLTLPIIAISLS